MNCREHSPFRRFPAAASRGLEIRVPWRVLTAATVLGWLAAVPVLADDLDLDAKTALRAVSQFRGRLVAGPGAVPSTWTWLLHLGRPAVKIEGWTRGSKESRRPYDSAVFDVRSGLVAVYVNFGNVSRREAGEPIHPMSEASKDADRYLALLYPEGGLPLEGIRRYGVRGGEGVYYEVRYSTSTGGVRYFQALVEMLLDASTGNLYRYELAVDFLDSKPAPKVSISRAAAEKIAAVTLRKHNLAAHLGEGAVFSAALPATMGYVRPNTWFAPYLGEDVRLAWVVPFRIDGGGAVDLVHHLFVEAGSGKIIGGAEGTPE